MPVISIRTSKSELSAQFTAGSSLLKVMNDSGVAIRAGCGGRGTCGSCRIQIEQGESHPPTATELKRLTPNQTGRGIRLACQVRPDGDLQINVPTLPQTLWQYLPEENHGLQQTAFPEFIGINSAKAESFGVAVDLGTTHIRLSLWDLNKQVRLAGRYGLNAQHRFGSDVMTRLTAAVTSSDQAHEIGQSARDSIRDALQEISTTEEFQLAAVNRIVIVGNSAMLALCAETNYSQLLKPAYWSQKIVCQPEDTGSWRAAWRIDPSATIELVPPLAGFVGSDLLAGVLATGMVQLPAGELLIDFGTNSEIALWDGNTLWSTSAAGGPAFEGCGISCGMPAEPGAVFRVEPGPSGADWHSEVIEGGEARGICGSGLVDIIALLRREGRLNSAGRFRKLEAGQEISIIEGKNGLTLKSQDVDAFQRAKAAIGAGIGILLKQAGMTFGDIRHIFVCGAFGRLLDLKNAQEIGLLPEISTDRIELWGDSALAGCEQLLFLTASGDAMEELRSISQIVNLALIPEFEEEFVRNLYLRPLA